jgi:hypothetical protein
MKFTVFLQEGRLFQLSVFSGFYNQISRILHLFFSDYDFYSGDKILPFKINDKVFHALPFSSLL